MSPSALALTGFAAWTLFLVLMIGLYRAGLVLTGRRAPNQFDPGGADVGEFSRRLCRAHANCYENLPIFGALDALAQTAKDEIQRGRISQTAVAKPGHAPAHHRIGQLDRIAGRNQKTCFLIANHLRNAADLGGDDRKAAGHGIQKAASHSLQMG